MQGTIGDVLDRLEQGLLKLEKAAVEKIGRFFSEKTRKEISPAPSKRRKYQESGEEAKPSQKSTQEKQLPKKLESWVAEERELMMQVGARIHML